MKRITNYLIAMALMAFTFTSCEDVPNPFGQILPPGGDEETETFEPAGTGTQADPFNVQGVLEYVTGLGADVQSDKDVYIKGYVTTIKEQYSAQYGNAQFTISDSKEGGNTFTFYRGLFLGNKKWEEGNATISEGDEVIICGKVVNYKGTTPETVQNAAYLYSLNGKTEGGGGGGDTPTPSGDAKAVSVSDFLAAAESTSDWYQLTGTIKNLKDGDQYGNFDIVDATGSVYVYGLLSEKGGEKKKFQELVAAKGIANGKKITIIGNRGAYNGTPQVANAYFVSIEDGGGSDTPTPSGATGTGTKDDPFNIAAAIAKCQEIGETASTEKYYIKDIVVTGGTVSGGYGNVTFKMGDTKDATDLFTAYQVAGSDGEKLADGYEVKAGDEVVVYGPICNYKGNTPETSGKSAAQIVTINGKKTNDTSGGESGGGSTTGADGSTIISVADFNAAAESTDVWYQLTGTIKNLKDGDQYGNFDLEDSTGSVYVYGVLSEKGGEKKKFQDLATAKGIANGKKITIVGNRGSYNGKIEVLNAYFIKVE